MSAPGRNRFLAVLAWQTGHLSEESLAELLATDASPARTLLQRGVLPEELALLEQIAERRWQHYGGDLARCLETLPLLAAIRERLISTTPADPLATLPTQGREPSAETPGDSRRDSSRYRVVRSHARGGLGEVFVAIDEELKREVALKEIQARYADHTESRSRFQREAEITGRLEHPGIVPVYGLGVYTDGRPYYAMRFIKGESLRHAIEAKTLTLRQLLDRFREVCNAIAYAHSHGVLHRDLKPDNVMLGTFGETLVVDWGLAKEIRNPKSEIRKEEREPVSGLLERASGMTRTGDVLGTPAYMPPEQAAGRLDDMGPASDVYALGATLYHILTGKAPFAGELHALLDSVRAGRFPRPRAINPSVPAPLEAVCLKAMALKPEERYTSAQELAADIERWLGDEAVSAHPEPWSVRFGRWRRRHPALVSGALALAFTALLVGSIAAVLVAREKAAKESAEELRTRDQVEALFTASPQAVPDLLETLRQTGQRTRPRLREIADRNPPPGQTPASFMRYQLERTRAAIALLPDEPERLDFLRKRLLQEDLEPDEMLLIRDSLAGHRESLTAELWAKVEHPDVQAEEQLRALAALASYDPDSPRWPKVAWQAAAGLTTTDLAHAASWSRAFRHVAGVLRQPLHDTFRGRSPERLSQRRVAGALLQNFAAGQPDALAEVLMDAEPAQFSTLHQEIASLGKAIPAIEAALARAVTAVAATGAERDVFASRQVNAAVALLHLGKPESVWRLFRHGEHPDAQTHLLHRVGSLRVEAKDLVGRLRVENDPSARQALILALGEYPSEQLDAALRSGVTQLLLEWYDREPDPGIHGAIDWLLRHGEEGLERRKHDWGGAAALRKIDEERQGKPAEGRRWYVNGQGQTMAIVPGPVQFLMGSPSHEPGHQPNELFHRRRIGRSFALASKEVTAAQFRRFLKAYPDIRHVGPRFPRNTDDEPIVSVQWYEAAQYCRWLSEQEGVAEEQMCYPPVEQIEKAKASGAVLKMPANYLTRTGYRLPTEAEWECACRGGTESAYHFGHSAEHLHQYGWSVYNSRDRTWPVGQKKPNRFGLFDMHGNVWEWCQESGWAYEPVQAGKFAEDDEDRRDVTDSVSRVLRGGSFVSRPPALRSAGREGYRPSDRFETAGFRPARTHR